MKHNRSPEAALNPAPRRVRRGGIAVLAAVAAAGCVAAAVPALAAAAAPSAHQPAAHAAHEMAHVSGLRPAAKHSTKTTMYGAKAYVGASATLSARVTGGSTPTGTVRFTDGSKTMCSARLSGGKAHCSAKFSGVGTPRVKASYGGNGSHRGSSGSALVHVIKAPTTTTVTPIKAVAGKSVTLLATVKSTSSLSAAGTVTFYNGTAKLCTATVARGGGGCAHTFGKAETYPVTAKYSGNYAHDASASKSPADVVITAAGLVGTTTSIGNPDPATAPAGPYPFDVTVAVPAGDAAPTGTVEVFSLAQPDLNPPLPADAYTCTFTLTAADDGAGSCDINTGVDSYGFIEVEATYEGSTTYATSTSTGEHKLINPISTTTTVANATGAPGGNATIVATVTPADGGNLLSAYSDIPDVVNFTVGGANVCANTPITYTGGEDIATCTYAIPAGTAAGAEAVTATFPGDEYAATSTGDGTLTVS